MSILKYDVNLLSKHILTKNQVNIRSLKMTLLHYNNIMYNIEGE